MTRPLTAVDVPPTNRNYVLFMLLTVYLFSLIDRQILAVLIEPIRKDLGLSDTQIGMLSGLAFGLIYATAAIPLAWLGDRTARRGLIAVSLTVWSIATGLCGVAQGFWHLFAARVLVGTGEAGAGPSSQSLIADYFPPERRATALGIYAMGIFIGAGAGLAIGGWLASLYGWRGAFAAVAIPGVVFAAIFYLTVREPRRGAADPGSAGDTGPPPPFLESVRLFVRTPALLPTTLGMGFSVFTVQSLLNWLPAFLSRYHGLAPAAAGGRIGPIIAVAGTLGVLSGGLLADRLSLRDRRHSPRMMAVTSLLVVLAGVTTLLAQSHLILFGALAVTFFLTATVSGPSFALIQNQTPVRTRAMSAALVGLVAVILGNAMGPFLTGLMSDVYARAGVAEPLRWSLVTSISLSLFGALSYAIAAARLPRGEPA